MAKKKISFTGPSVRELGIETEGIANTENGIGRADITRYSSGEDGIAKNGNTVNSITKDGNTVFTLPQNMEVKDEKSRPLHFRIVRDYLYAALGDADCAEIKLSVMGEELGINPKTLYKHLKTLRETEFILTKLQFSTEIRRRQAKNNS